MDNSAKPFVKWAGGKTQLINDIEISLPDHFMNQENIIYVEPFVGGGAVLFWILQQYPNIQKAIINDVNSELISTYRIIKKDVNGLINSLQILQDKYLALNHDGRTKFFLEKRKKYNSRQISELEMATLFIFLNKTCFNGLYRVNSKGEFNVPHGKYKNPKICDSNNLLMVSALLQKVDILCGDFSQTLKYASHNSLYYFDPPYKPITKTSAFTSYSSNGFDDSEQIRLKNFCDTVTQNKALFIASNSDPTNINPDDSFFDTLYNNFNIKRVSATRMINCDGSSRGKIRELLITNRYII